MDKERNELDRDWIRLTYEGKEVAFIYLDKQVEVIDNIESLLGGARRDKAYTIDRIDNSIASVIYDSLDSSENFLITKIMVHDSCFVSIMGGSRAWHVDFRRICSDSFNFDIEPNLDIEFCVDKKIYNLRELNDISNMLGDFHVKTNDYKIFTRDTGTYKFGIVYYKNKK